mmetsp:Transcript_24113/g.40984  ORF Transcript_24113/g.40984 Transcript_24113/m.40984 type:complete len:81 (-) Transcript_24113:58-300(-)
MVGAWVNIFRCYGDELIVVLEGIRSGLVTWVDTVENGGSSFCVVCYHLRSGHSDCVHDLELLRGEHIPMVYHDLKKKWKE